MSDRMTSAHLDARTENLNRRLAPTGRHVEWQGRNGYVGLDEYRGSECVRTLILGSKREVGDFLHAMMVGIDLSLVSPDA